ncbi:MAG: J domain-containing protein [Clostridiales bacterium]|nr:J domain-containing protein [Clostridiales bacterium]
MEIFWDTLGLKPTTDISRIRKAYSKLVKLHPPEDNEEEFKRINSAYKAATKFARQFSAMGVTDDQIEIVDRREDGSFGVKILTPDGKPFVPPPFPLQNTAPGQASKDLVKQVEDPLFDFESIDSSVVTALTSDELNNMSGFISLVPGYNVPDSQLARQIKKYLYEDLGAVDTLAKPSKPETINEDVEKAIAVASSILTDSRFTGEKLLWSVYFTSPLVSSMFTSLTFYRRLEDVINKASLEPKYIFVIADASPFRPRAYVMNDKPVGRIDFLSKVPFRYERGKYPELERLLIREDPVQVSKLMDFLSKVPMNLYGILMPYFRPDIKAALEDATFAFNYILTSPDCKEMKENELMWLLFFEGRLIKPIVKDANLHTMITKRTMELKLSKAQLTIMKNAMPKPVKSKVRRKKEDKDWYYLEIKIKEALFKKKEVKDFLTFLIVAILFGIYLYFFSPFKPA